MSQPKLMSDRPNSHSSTGRKNPKDTDASSDLPATRKQRIIENITSLGMALLLVFMIRSSVVEAFKIPSGSMIPTLLIGDHIFVNKFAYGLKVPFSDWVTDHPIYMIKREPPNRGDIVVFLYPKDESLYYIKRVIGTPGDTIELRNKALFINGQPVDRNPLTQDEAEKIFSSLDDGKYSRGSLELFREQFGDKKHLMMIDRSNFLGDAFGPITVPEGSLFVMGDNRDYSNDSRFWGFVPVDNVKGKAMVIWLSVALPFGGQKASFQPSRIGTVLK